MIVRELVNLIRFKMNSGDVQKAEGAMKSMRSSAAGVAASMAAIVAPLVGLAGLINIVRIADEMQSLRARIEQLPQTIGDAGEAFDVIADRANNAKQSLQGYAEFYIKAASATQDFVKEQSEVLKIVDGVAFGLAASGANAVAQEQAFFQLGQAIGSPVVQMEELNTLIDVAPDLFRELGKTVEGADGNLKEFVSTGAVTGKMLAEGLVKAASTFESKMKKMPITVGQATTIVGNRWSMMIDRMNRESLFITKIADFILKGFDRIESGVKSVVELFGGWNNALRYLGAIAAAALGAILISIGSIGASALLVVAPFVALGAAILTVAALLEDVYVWIQGGESLTGDLIGSWEEWRDVVFGVYEAIKSIFAFLGEAIGAITALLVGIFEFDLNLIKASLDGIGKIIFSVVKQWGKWIYDGIFNPIKTAIKDGLTAPLDFPSNMLKSGMDWITGKISAVDAATGYKPSQLGQSRPNMSNNTTVNVTVPAGTTAEQASFINNVAKKSFTDSSDKALARQMSVYAP